MYLLLGSLGLVGLGLYYLFGNLYMDLKNRRISTMTGPSIFMALSLITTILLSAALFMGSTRFDTWIYGRYAEGVISPVIAAGFMAFKTKRNYYILLVAMISAVLLGLAHKVGASHTFYAFISAFWVGMLFHDHSPWIWPVAYFPLFMIIGFFKTVLLRFVTLSLFFFLALLFVQQLSVIPSSEFWCNRAVLPNAIRTTADLAGKPIFIEPPDLKEPYMIQLAYKSHFVFHLYDRSVRQMHFEEWQAVGDALLVSFRDDPGVYENNLYIVKSETQKGPHLWRRE